MPLPFRKQEIQLKAPLDIGAGKIVGPDGVVEELGVEVHRLAANAKDLAEPTAEGHHPLVAVGPLPVGGDDGSAGDEPAVRQVVVDEVLRQEPA